MLPIRCLRLLPGGAVRLPPLLAKQIDVPVAQQRSFTALSRVVRVRVAADVIAGSACGRRLISGKTGEPLTLLLHRWSKLAWSNMFGKYLLVTNVLGSGLLMVVGDVVAQEYEYRRGLRRQDRYDTDRMLRMFVAGALQGPLHHYVYNWMDRIMPARTMTNIAKKILIDQLVMSPACIFIFFYSVCYLEGQTLECTNKELIGKFPYIYLLDWMTWPAAQYINFRYLDTKYRVTFVNICTAVYNVLISYMKHDFGIHLPLEHETQPSFVESLSQGLRQPTAEGPTKSETDKSTAKTTH
ncbi:mpv17-like protein 2 [Drosophila guanche]|uniref:Blast:Mpv17-like protein 2 n=1 Tax=Drosophila guanche TaxID=7266 RepID=A0A3B0KF32_DROGU|nr:mpv17-like protein 2 [Drosophila guanche]SPP84919.1 blast:Mpv17-like protein 2 [Drosophila guanche]